MGKHPGDKRRVTFADEPPATVSQRAGPMQAKAKYVRSYVDDNKVFNVVEEKQVAADRVMFSQDSCYHKFSDGSSYEKLFEDIMMGRSTVHQFPAIRVVRRADGNFTSHDNRRLLLMRWLFEEKVVDKIPVQIVDTPIPA